MISDTSPEACQILSPGHTRMVQNSAVRMDLCIRLGTKEIHVCCKYASSDTPKVILHLCSSMKKKIFLHSTEKLMQKLLYMVSN